MINQAQDYKSRAAGGVPYLGVSSFRKGVFPETDTGQKTGCWG
jgi:hypothetical protein